MNERDSQTTDTMPCKFIYTYSDNRKTVVASACQVCGLPIGAILRCPSAPRRDAVLKTQLNVTND